MKFLMKSGHAVIYLAATAVLPSMQAEEVSLNVEKAVVITFPSQDSRTYKLLGADTAEGPWRSLQDGITGTGGDVTVFYKSQSDQKLFFKVEGRDGSPAPQLLLSPAQQALLAAARLDLSGQNLAGSQLAGGDLKLFRLDEAILDNADLRGANFSSTGARRTSFKGADLRGMVTDGASNFDAANFNGANLEGTRIWANMGGSDFRNAKLNGAYFILTSVSWANFSGQNFSNAVFQLCNFDAADLTGAQLAGGDLSRNSFQRTVFDGATFGNVKLEGSLFIGVPLTGRDLRGALLRGVLLKSDWSGVNAAGVDASLIYVDQSSSLAGANLAGANLEGAVMTTVTGGGYYGGPATVAGANLAGANLRGAKLQGADLRGVNLSNVDFTGADLSFAELQGATLTGATGFDPEQPGMQFGSGVVLPNGTTRAGVNSGTGLAPASAPGRLRFEINDSGNVATRELAFGPNGYTEPGRTGGAFTYEAKGMIATLGLPHPSFPQNIGEYYTLHFTSPTGGRLFKNSRAGIVGVFSIGTFAVSSPLR
jgi:uncharacterized protein YjbI with pentapeptide repeats